MNPGVGVEFTHRAAAEGASVAKVARLAGWKRQLSESLQTLAMATGHGVAYAAGATAWGRGAEIASIRSRETDMAKKATRKPARKSGGKAAKPAAKKGAAKKKGRRTTHRSSKGTKLYAVRDASGKFKDIQTYKRAHGMDLKRKSSAERASSEPAPSPVPPPTQTPSS